MGLLSFRGGVHPPYKKALTQSKSIKQAGIPDLLMVPLLQHIGAPCEPTVKVGDEVSEGQMIGNSKAFVSAPVHAPVSGKVKKIEPVLHPLGMKVPAVFIQPDGNENKSYMEPLRGYSENSTESLDRNDLINRVREAGIVGMGGATFPTHVKLSPPKDKPIDTLIINGCECEPYLTADHRLMVERPTDIIRGALLIARAIDAKKIFIAIEDNKPDAVESMRKSSEGTGIECVTLATKYPQGAEKMLIKAVVDREVPSGGLPMDVGTLVSNVGTAVAVYEAVALGKPLIERIVTVTGDIVASPGNFLVKIGTPVTFLIEETGGIPENLGKIVMGGPMMGLAQQTLEVPVIKGTSGILILPREEKEYTYRPCIKCSFCVQVCPVHLIPSRLSILGEAEEWEKAEDFGVNDCIECGSCTYVCPSKRPIVQLIKATKAKLREIKTAEGK